MSRPKLTGLEQAILADFEQKLAQQEKSRRNYCRRIARQWNVSVEAATWVVTQGERLRSQIVPVQRLIKQLKQTMREKMKKK